MGVISSVNTFDISEDAILIIKDGAGVGRVHFAQGKYSVIGTLNYLTAKPTINLKYIYYCLSVFCFDKYIVGSGIPHIYFKDYSKASIYCPSEDKQQKVVQVLDSLTGKLDIDVKLLMKYKAQKAYLIQQLFI